MPFNDRLHAACDLARKLVRHRGSKPLVLAVPRGGVPMGRLIAEALDGDLDVVLVHRIGAPGSPELAVASVGEDGVVRETESGAALRVDRGYVEAEAARQLRVMRERRRLLGLGAQADPAGRTVIVVDDGVATGTTIAAALRMVRAGAPARLVAAVGVASPEAVRRLEEDADEVVCGEVVPALRVVGAAYGDFTPVSDDDAERLLAGFRARRRRREIGIDIEGGLVRGDLFVPDAARGIVVFAHGPNSNRKGFRNCFVAAELHDGGFATLIPDLRTPEEERDPRRTFDVDRFTERLARAIERLGAEGGVRDLPLGLFGADTGVACALRIAARMSDRVAAVVSRGGRPDLAGDLLGRVVAPTLLLVGGEDRAIHAPNRYALERLGSKEKRLAVVPGATHFFEEPGALESVADAASSWFAEHLVRPA